MVCELLKWFVGLSEHTLAAIVLGIGEFFSLSPSHPTSLKMKSMADELHRELQVTIQQL